MSPCRILTSAAVLLIAVGYSVAGDYKPPKFLGKIGYLTFENDTSSEVKVTLWHPDNGEAFANWTIASGKTFRLLFKNEAIRVGDDWGVQIGNAKVVPLSQFATWNDGSTEFKASARACGDATRESDVPCVTVAEAGKGVRWPSVQAEQRTVIKTKVTIQTDDGKTKEIEVDTYPQAAVSIDKAWKNGTALAVQFVDSKPDIELVKKVARYVREWEQYVNLRFVIIPPDRAITDYGIKKAHIRISFADSGHYSQVGTDSEAVDRHSMNLQLNRNTPEAEVKRVVLHEFGHALGFQHEHQNPKGGIKWNEEKVIAYFKQHQSWDEQKIRHNILAKLDTASVAATDFDSKSIMLYAFPASLTKDGYSAGWNRELSNTDKLAASGVYPYYVDKVCGAVVRVSPGYLPMGVMVGRIGDKSPYTSLTRFGNSNITGVLELGDVITVINGKEVKSLDDYKKATDPMPDRLVIRVRDVRTGKDFDWQYP